MKRHGTAPNDYPTVLERGESNDDEDLHGETANHLKIDGSEQHTDAIDTHNTFGWNTALDFFVNEPIH